MDEKSQEDSPDMMQLEMHLEWKFQEIEPLCITPVRNVIIRTAKLIININ